MAVTETVRKYQEILSKLLPNREEISNIDLLVVQSEDKTKIMILKVATSIVDDVKLIYKEIQEEVNKKFPGYTLFVIRNEEIKTKAQARNLHEKWIGDLSFPALVKERTTDYIGDEVVENVMVQENASLNEKALRNREFTFKTLTERNVRFSLASQ